MIAQLSNRSQVHFTIHDKQNYLDDAHLVPSVDVTRIWQQICYTLSKCFGPSAIVTIATVMITQGPGDIIL